MYCRRPAASVPTAWMWPLGRGQIHTCSQAGGMTSSRQRSTSESASRTPVWSRKTKPLPARRRVHPGSFGETVLSRGTLPVLPAAARSNVTLVADLRIVPITPARLGDLDTLFARGDPRTCQCAYLRLTHADYAHTSPAEHRDVHHRAVRRAARAKRAAGLIAYDDGAPVGWVSFGPREEFARIVASPVPQP